MRLTVLALLLMGCTASPGDKPVDTDTDVDTDVSADACVSCHVGIEPSHVASSIRPGDCTVCHGGDKAATDKALAHVAVPEDWATIRGDDLPTSGPGYIRDFSPDQLDQLEPAYLRFINPGDIRIADQTCGLCHPQHVETVRNSIMTTNAGHYMPSRFLAGFQGRDAIYGSWAAVDHECDPEAHPGSVCEFEPLRPPGDAVTSAAIDAGDLDLVEEQAYDHYLAKRCNHCHAAGFGKNDSPHLYRSTGCTACHMVYNKNGTYEGGDQAMPGLAFPFSDTHVITAAIPTEQCATCHFQGGRIGLLFRGIREAGFPGLKPENAVSWEPGAYGRGDPDFYLSDEDHTNEIDETPPDLHYAAGMHCADCHVGSDVHGDGRIWSTSKQQVDIACEDCHGTVRDRRTPDAAGLYRTSGRGRPLKVLSTDDQGQIVHTGVDGTVRVVKQVADVLTSGLASDRMVASMAPDEHDWSHADSLTCDTCHTSYTLNCLGCHVEVNYSLSQIDLQTGEGSAGVVAGNRQRYSLDSVLIGLGVSGKAQTVNASAQVQLTVRDGEGAYVLGDEVTEGRDEGVFRHTTGAENAIGFAPFYQHTSTRNARTCVDCHRQDATPAELTRVRGVYGYGTGEFMLPHPGGEPVDALRWLDDEGNPLTEWVHEGTGPLPTERRERALGVVLDELED